MKEKDENYLEKAGEKVLDALEDGKEAADAYEELKETVQSLIEERAATNIDSAIDVKAMSTL